MIKTYPVILASNPFKIHWFNNQEEGRKFILRHMKKLGMLND